MNEDILQALLTSLDEGEAVALISVTSATGAYEGAMGNHALLWIDSERQPLGDLGLGELNDHIYYDARRALLDREHRHLTYTRPSSEASNGGAEHSEAPNGEAKHSEASNGGAKHSEAPNGEAKHSKAKPDEVKVFVEVQVQPSHLIIVGAGHIAVPLASIASTCDFSVTVLDDRPQYAHPARFPTANQVIAGPFREELAALRAKSGLNKHTYIVLVTRGHQYDVDCLVEVLDDPLAYIGMIGSKRRIRAVFELLEQEQGIPPEKFDRVYAPVGLDIGARTPAEIAVCIMAEIINVMRQGAAIPMSQQIRQERQARRQRVAAAHS
jgi:xanthine dehydrogenase accessory factor